jgi:Amt family ammonium transporter
MTPGLALFYGGMVRARSVVNMLMMSFGALALVPVLWVLFGYSSAFGDDVGFGLLGDPTQFAGLTSLLSDTSALPVLAFAAFQCVFAVITLALISGAIADRAKFGAWMLFGTLWTSLVYFPVAHWVFDFTTTDEAGAPTHTGGWIANDLGALDFAGGTAVHINAGAAALVLALVLGKRVGWRKGAHKPHNMTLVMLGAGLLWFGWVGFNAGSALGANASAALVLLNTLAAPAAAALGWMLTERLTGHHVSSLGVASGVVAGLVAITPAANAVSPLGALGVGLVAGVLCALAVELKYKLKYDDSLDVVAVHLVGGLWGTLSIGLLGTSAAPAGVDGLLLGGGLDQLWRQGVGALAVMAFSMALTWVIAVLLDKVVGMRVSPEVEASGIDKALHGEDGYDHDVLVPEARTAAEPAVRAEARQEEA